MGRKASIDRLPPEARARIQKHLRDNRLTLDELIADLQQAFPSLAVAGELPSRSAVHRYSLGVREIVAHEREMTVAAEALVAELGDNFDAKSGALLAQAVTTLASRRAMQAIEASNAGTVMDISDVLDLARAAKTAQEARSLNLKERRSVADEARKKAFEDAAQKASTSAKQQGMSAEGTKALRAAIMEAL